MGLTIAISIMLRHQPTCERQKATSYDDRYDDQKFATCLLSITYGTHIL